MNMSEPPISDQRKGPPGVLPKNIQAWVMVGVALLIVAVVALSGKKAPTIAPGLSGATTGSLDETTRQIQDLKAAQERLQQEAILAQQQMAQAPLPQLQSPDANLSASPAPGEDLAA